MPSTFTLSSFFTCTQGEGFQVSVVASVPSEQSSLSADVGFYATQGAVGAFLSLPGLERGNRRLDERVQCQGQHSPRGVLELKKVKNVQLFSVDARWGRGEMSLFRVVLSKPSDSSFIERASLFCLDEPRPCFWCRLVDPENNLHDLHFITFFFLTAF